jgi:uroporphyrinogen-III decarboxylase
MTLLESMKDVKDYVLSSGCDLVPGTPPENIDTVLDTVRSYRV